MKTIIAFSFALFTSLMALPCIAQEYYLFAQFGQSRFDVGEANVAIDDTDTTLGLGFGVELSPNLALEAAYHDFGELKIAQSGIDVSAFSGALIGQIPLGASLGAYGKLGFDVWEAESSTTSSDGNDLFFGLGLSYELNNSAALRLEFNRHDFSGDNGNSDVELDTITVGVRFSL